MHSDGYSLLFFESLICIYMIICIALLPYDGLIKLLHECAGADVFQFWLVHQFNVPQM